MKKTLFCLFLSITVFFVVAFSASATEDLMPDELAPYGQKTLQVYKLKTGIAAPVQDGVIGDGEYGASVTSMSVGDGYSYSSFGLDAADATTDSTLYMTYDDTYLYVAVTAKDPDHHNPNTGLNVWKGDYLEFDIGIVPTYLPSLTDKMRFAVAKSSSEQKTFAYFDLFASYATAVEHDRQAVFSDSSNDPLADKIKAEYTDGVITYEFALPLTYCFGAPVAPDKAMFYYQHGMGDSDYADSSNGAYQGLIRYGKRLSDDERSQIAAHAGELTDSIPASMYSVLQFIDTEKATTTTTAPTQNDAPQQDDDGFPVGGIVAIAAAVVTAALAVCVAVKRKK